MMLDVVAVTRAPDGVVVCDRCHVADSMWSRMKGLLGRNSLASGEGMAIRPAPSIHTFFMRFPIDAVFLSRNGDVLKVSPNVKPWRARLCSRAHTVLELADGEAKRHGIARGQRLMLERKEQ
jgi:uncharacterized membrane protein (UPF0127 family)